MTDRAARFALASRRVVTPEAVRTGAVVISGERIEAIVRREDVPRGLLVEDLGDLVISPGIVDSHVHINEPGRTEWEGFETATLAAAAGGVTTLIDMPLNSSPVTTTVAALEEKRAAAKGQCWVDVGFYGGLVPGNLAHIEPLLDAGVCGVKAFLCNSGLAEFGASGEADLRAALPILERRGVPLLVHAEIVSPVERAPSEIASYSDWLASRPAKFERDAVALLRNLAAEYRARIHVVHLADADQAFVIRDAKDKAIPLSVETCPHYLYFSAEKLVDADPRFKCAPPIREEIRRKMLWIGLTEGMIDTIGSDHSPCPPEMKHLARRDWQAAWGGVSSLQLTLSIVRKAASDLFPSMPLHCLATWLSTNPARLSGLSRKGRIAAQCDADLCVWDPNEEWTVRGEDLHHRHKLTPYDGERLRGRVKRTYVRGHLAYDNGKFPAGPIGKLLEREGSARSL